MVASATSVDVERVFSHGRLILTHTRSRLSVQATRALLCLGPWSLLNLVKDADVAAVTKMQDAEEDVEFASGWMPFRRKSL